MNTHTRTIQLGELSGLHVSCYRLEHRITAYGYVIREKDKAGALDAKKAKAMGVTGRVWLIHACLSVCVSVSVCSWVSV